MLFHSLIIVRPIANVKTIGKYILLCNVFIGLNRQGILDSWY